MKKDKTVKSLNIAINQSKKYTPNYSQAKNTVCNTFDFKHNQQNKCHCHLDPETQRLGKGYLDELYEKYSTNLKRYIKNNYYGLRLIGNELFTNYPMNYYQQNDCEEIGKIIRKMDEMKLSFISPNNYNELKGKSTFTPIPIKNKQLLKSNKEKSDLYEAERTAVMMRIYEFTYGIKSNVAILEVYKKESEEKKMTILFLKKVVNKIENWWKKIKQKQYKSQDPIIFNNNIDIEGKQVDIKYQKCRNKKQNKKGFDKLKGMIMKRIKPIKQNIFNKLKLCLYNKSLGLKIIKRNIDDWFKCNMIVNNEKLILVNPRHYRQKPLNKAIIANKTVYRTQRIKMQMNILIRHQKRIKRYIKNKKEKGRKDTELLIKKPLKSICNLDKIYQGTSVYIVKWLNRFMYRKIKINNFYNVNDLFINPIYNHDTNYDINTFIDKANNNANNLFNKNSVMRYSGYASNYSNQIKRNIISIWRKAAFEMNKKADSALFKISLKSFILTLSTISSNYLHWAFNKIIARRKAIDTCNQLVCLLKVIAGKSIILSVKKRLKHKHILILLTNILIKQSMHSIFNEWRMQIRNIKSLSKAIRLYSMYLSKELFFTALSQTNKNIVTNYIEMKSNKYIDDNIFKYYCFVNRADNQNDFSYMRISLGMRIAFTLLIQKNDLSFALRLIKTKRKIRAGICKTIQLNPKLSSKLNQFKETIQKIDLILVKQYSHSFFNRMIFNHLVSALSLNNQELLLLLKAGAENVYQEVFNRLLELKLIDKVKTQSDVDLIKYVQKYIVESTKC